MTFIIAIDGPAGTGKSSVAKEVAKLLNYSYIDTGAIYRALAYAVLTHGVDGENEAQVLHEIGSLNIGIDHQVHRLKIEFEGRVLDAELRSEAISRLSSIVSSHKRVREALLTSQRVLVNAVAGGAIFEGRDIGTVVFPKSPLKIFITANSETRARRRFSELAAGRTDVSFEEVHEAIKKRDERDKNRINSPMHRAADAHEIDSSALTLHQVIQQTLELVKNAQASFKDGAPLW